MSSSTYVPRVPHYTYPIIIPIHAGMTTAEHGVVAGDVSIDYRIEERPSGNDGR